jgi:hypothetical protein
MRSWNIGSDKDGESIQRVGFSKKIIIVQPIIVTASK